MHGAPHSTVCIVGIYVVCSSKRIQWTWGSYLLRYVIKRLVVECASMLVGFRHSYNKMDRFNSCSVRLELALSLSLAVHIRHILLTIWATRRNSQYSYVGESLTQWVDWSLRILQVCLLCFPPFLWNITWREMENNSHEGTTIVSLGAFEQGVQAYFPHSRCTFQLGKGHVFCRQSDEAMLSSHLCMDGLLI